MTELDHAHDVVGFLTTQHALIRDAMQRVTTSTGSEREEAFTHLRKLLAIHETAEEQIVHPRAREVLEGGEEIVARRLEEENAGKAALAELEAMDLESTEFETRFRAFHDDVLEHAAAEEREEFATLPDHLDPAQLERMQRAVELVEAVAPTRPHPGVESQAANLIVGPFASMLDRARDLLGGH